MPLSIIFDVDGLLLDTERIAREGWRHALAARGLSLTDEFYLNLVGKTLEANIPILLAEFGPDIPVDELYAGRREYIHSYIHQHGIEDRPGARHILDYLSENQIRIAVGSSSPTEYSLEKLALTGLADYFKVTVFGDEVSFGKPAPDIFLEAANRLGVMPDDCIVLEDSAAGVHAAHAAGMRVIMVPDLIQPDEELRRIAYAVLPDLYAARVLLEKELIPQMQ